MRQRRHSLALLGLVLLVATLAEADSQLKCTDQRNMACAKTLGAVGVVPNVCTTGTVVNGVSSLGVLNCVASAGGTGVPNGNIGALQYNAGAGVFGGDNNFTDDGAGTLTGGKFIDKGGTVYNVRAFGAVGTGLVNDAPSIQNALDSADVAGGGTVFLPCGTYLLQATLLVGDNTTIASAGPCAVLKRDATTSSDPSFFGSPPSCTPTTTCRGYPATSCDTERVVIRNKKKDCGNAGITLRDFAIDGSLIPSLACGVNCTGGPDFASVAIIMSAVKDLLIDHLLLKSVPQDAIFVKNVGDKTTISHTIVDGFNMAWGNGAAINGEMHTTALIPGTGNFSDNYIVARGPEFCTADLSTPCDVNSTCTSCPGGSCGGVTCSGGSRNGKPCTGTCGAQQITAISVPLVDISSQPPQVIIARNRIELTDNHNGIVLTGANGTIISENRLTAIDSGTALTKVFQGIGLNGPANRHLNDVTIDSNIIIGGNAASDKRAVLVNDSTLLCNAGCTNAGIECNSGNDCTGCSSGCATVPSPLSHRIRLTGNIIKDKSPDGTTILAPVTVRGIAEGLIAGNLVENVTASAGIEVGSSSSATTEVRIANNQITDVTGTNKDCLTLRNTTNAQVFGNSFKNCPRGVELVSGTPSGNTIFGNAYASVAKAIQQTTVDSTLRIVERGQQAAIAFADLLTPLPDGSEAWCRDCQAVSPCAGGGTGADAQRASGIWTCSGITPDPLNAINPASRIVFGSSDKSNATDPTGFWMLGGYSKNQLFGINKLSNVTISSTGTLVLSNPSLAFSGTENPGLGGLTFTVATPGSDTVGVEATTTSGSLPTSIFSSGFSMFSSAQFRSNGSFVTLPQTIMVEARYTNSDGAACNTVACPYVTVFGPAANAQSFWTGGLTFSPSIAAPSNIFAVRWTFSNWTAAGQNFIISLGLHHRSEEPFPGYVRRDGAKKLLGTLTWSDNLGAITDLQGPTDQDYSIASGAGKRLLLNGKDASQLIGLVEVHSCMPITGNQASGLFMAPSACLDPTETNAQDAFASAVTLGTLRCNTGVSPTGSSVIFTGRLGACGATLADNGTGFTCTVAVGASPPVCVPTPATNTMPVSAGNCFSMKVTTGGTLTNAVTAGCTMERAA